MIGLFGFACSVWLLGLGLRFDVGLGLGSCLVYAFLVKFSLWIDLFVLGKWVDVSADLFVIFLFCYCLDLYGFMSVMLACLWWV